MKYAGDAVRKMIADREQAGSGSVVYWHDMTTVAYETLVDTFEHIVRNFANGAEPLA